MKTSLIISTYNWSEALNLCLKSLLIQTQFPDEVIIADDGSTIETTNLVKSFSAEAPFPVIHVWHEDKGFRAGKIRNKAIAKAQFEYIIQIDGDVILHPQYIKDHHKIAKKNHFIIGSRVLLGKTLSDNILLSKQIKFSFWKKGIIGNRFYGLYLPVIGRFIHPIFSNPKSHRRVKGCNIAFWKSDLIKVNGYDESMYGWGAEDTELGARLINSGVHKHTVRWAIIVYHIEHQYASRERMKINRKMLRETIISRSVWCKNGLNKYLGVGQILI